MGIAKQSQVAIPQTTQSTDGSTSTQYYDASTGDLLQDLRGYMIKDGDMYYDPSVGQTDSSKPITPEDVAQSAGAQAGNGGSGRSIAAGGGPKGTASNNFGYHEKPGLLGPAAVVGGLVNPGIGAALGMLSKGYNVANMAAVNDARVGLGLKALSPGQMAKQAMKDNKGQIANVNIGDNKYSVGFKGLSPDGKTNLTYNEAKTRAALKAAQVTETPKEQVTSPPKDKAPSFMSKLTGLDKGFARKALGIDKKTPEAVVDKAVKAPEESPASKITGLQKGWLSKALTQLTTVGKVAPEVAAQLPDTAPAPTARPGVAQAQQAPETPTPTPAPGPSAKATATTSGATGTGFSSEASAGLPAKDANTNVGFAGHPNAPTSTQVAAGAQPSNAASPKGVIDGSKPDRIGRVGLNSVDFSKMGLQPAMAAQMTSFQKAAIDSGIANKLSVNVTQAVRTPEQQKAIQAAGFSKTNFGYHNLGLAVDVSPTAINDKDQIVDQDTLDKSRQLAKNLGMSTLDPSWDPAHIEAHVPGQTAKSMKDRATDPTTGLAKLSPEEDLGVRQNSVPTPTAKPNIDTGFVSQDERPTVPGATPTQVTPSVNDNNAFGKMKQDMNTIGTPNTPAATGAKLPDTPAGLAAMGFTNRTPTEKAAIATTIAGELGQKSLANLSSKDPAAKAAAMAEVGSMVSTMENRAATQKFGSIAGALTPSQYNSLSPTALTPGATAPLTTTMQNARANPAVSKAVGSFYAGGIPGSQYGATNYHATAMANPPSWSGKMTDPTQLGQHTFGTLPGYSPDTATKAAQKAFGTMAGTTFSPGKKTDDTVSNPNFSGLGTPSGMTPSKTTSANIGASSLSTGLGVTDPSARAAATPGYGGAGLGYGGLGTGTSGAGSKTDSSSSSGNSSSSGSSGSSSSSGNSGGGGNSNSNSRDGASSPAGGYGSSASKGSTGGL